MHPGYCVARNNFESAKTGNSVSGKTKKTKTAKNGEENHEKTKP